jgi:hypothetical protein
MDQDHGAHYALLRQQIEHEDSLMTQRLSWLVAAQSFLFTAYAIVLNGAGPTVSQMQARHQGYLLASIPAVAIAANVLIYVSVLAGVMAMRHLRERWSAVAVASGLPPLQGSALTRGMGLAPPMLLPLVFLSVWIFLVIHA